MIDSTAIIDNTISNMTFIGNSISIWLCIAIIEFILIVWLLIKLKNQKKIMLDFSEMRKSDLRKSEDIDMNNLVNSIYHSKELYKELSKKCHPDRFANTCKQEIAEDIFKRISKNKRNYEQLILIKEEAKSKLDLNL